ncbi:MAG: ATP-binding cassette domain-containing protein [Puniceicoccales bacterium]|jgi:peptide/nickel transport system ATP-binding protein/oligopeptide transport system ATP-binding protein|nr:ATP-binding cassette domain-containing protein [Puniceicoccales bacterium]
MEENILQLRSVVISYPQRSWFFKRKKNATCAVEGISFFLPRGRILGIVGESGSGKSTLLKAIVKFIPIQKGNMIIDDSDVTFISQKEFFPYRRKIQIIPQDFCDTFNPKMSVAEILAEPLDIHFPRLSAKEKNARIVELLESVGLEDALLRRLPSELSGGQRQRLSIARGLAVNPEILICDEIVNACDLYTQKQILSLLTALSREKNIAILFVSHNIAVVAHFCHEILIVRHGRILETGTPYGVCSNPRHPYTQLLIDSIPQIEGEKIDVLHGSGRDSYA